MAERGWKRLLAGYSWFRGPGRFPIAAYSEFMPPPRFGLRANGSRDPVVFDADDPYGRLVTECEENVELRPGLAHIAHRVVGAMEHLGRGLPTQGKALYPFCRPGEEKIIKPRTTIRILRIASGGWIAARIRMRPPQRGHAKTSIENRASSVRTRNNSETGRRVSSGDFRYWERGAAFLRDSWGEPGDRRYLIPG
jgi:hypothetical protein